MREVSNCLKGRRGAGARRNTLLHLSGLDAQVLEAAAFRVRHGEIGIGMNDRPDLHSSSLRPRGPAADPLLRP
jgi:hypothetical protein